MRYLRNLYYSRLQLIKVIERGNDSDFGLAAAVYTKDIENAFYLAKV